MASSDGSASVTGMGLKDSKQTARTKKRAVANGMVRKTRICTFWEMGQCTRIACSFAHGYEELQNVPDLSKTLLCRFHKRGTCRYEECKFAHGWSELRPLDAVNVALSRQESSVESDSSQDTALPGHEAFLFKARSEKAKGCQYQQFKFAHARSELRRLDAVGVALGRQESSVESDSSQDTALSGYAAFTLAARSDKVKECHYQQFKFAHGRSELHPLGAVGVALSRQESSAESDSSQDTAPLGYDALMLTARSDKLDESVSSLESPEDATLEEKLPALHSLGAATGLFPFAKHSAKDSTILHLPVLGVRDDCSSSSPSMEMCYISVTRSGSTNDVYCQKYVIDRKLVVEILNLSKEQVYHD